MKHIILARVLVACFLLLNTVPLVNAQSFLKTLHYFTNSPDGANPSAGLTLSGNMLYGTTELGGLHGVGTVFRINLDGTGFTNLYSFSPLTGRTNSDGAYPGTTLALSGSALYGTAFLGGTSGNGSLFKINTDGTDFTNVYSFSHIGINGTNSDGSQPLAGLTILGNVLFGTANKGGLFGYGSVYSINTDGSDFTNMYSFTGLNDGGGPEGGLTFADNYLYGSTSDGGDSYYGVLFRINTNGNDYTTLFSFDPGYGMVEPLDNLVVSDNMIFGITATGVYTGYYGSVFSIGIGGGNYANLYNFYGGDTGEYARGGIILSGNTLYGTALQGGAGNSGMIFCLNTNGMDFQDLHDFGTLAGSNSTNGDGAMSYGELVLSSNSLYGTTSSGGLFGRGTLFSFSLPPPQLSIALNGTNAVLTWSTSGFTLQTTTSLMPPVVWTSISGQLAVTNSISSTQHFYRLSQ